MKDFDMSRTPAERPRKPAAGKPETKRAPQPKPVALIAPKDPNAAERIAKVLSRAGIASRRDAEQMIAEGRVTLNGKVLDTPAVTVTAKDKVTVDGKLLAPPEPPRLWLYHKPEGLVTTARDEMGRPTVFDHLPEGLPRVMTVGRLDLSSEGLLLLTNDGELKRKLELPQTGWLRKYRVRVNGRPEDGEFEPLRKGINIEGEQFQPMIVAIDRQQGANAWLTVGIREGRNREIRRAMEAVGFAVNRLIRTSYGPFQLGDLAPGEAEEVRPRMLRDQLGLAETPDARNTIIQGKNKGGVANVTTGRLAGKPLPRPTRVTTTARSEGSDDYRRDETRSTAFERAPRPRDGEERPRSYGDRPARNFEDRPARPYGEKPARSYGDKPARGFGDKPARGFGDKPARSFGDKPARGFGDKPAGGFGDKPARSFGDKPARSFGDKPARSFADKPARSFGDKPARSYDDKPARGFGDKPARSFGDKPARSYDDKPARGFGDKPTRSYDDKPARNFGDKPARSFGDKPARSFAAKPMLGRGGARTEDGAAAKSGNGPRGEGRPQAFGDKPRSFGMKSHTRSSDRPTGKGPMGAGKPNRGPRKG